VRRRLLSLVPAAAVLTGGCFPAVLHGPQVEPGLRGTAVASIAAGPTYVEGDEGGIRLRNAPIGLGIGHGWRATSDARPSLFVGAFVPIFFPAAQLDVYVQAPRAWTGGASGGLGLNIGGEQATPYLQVGRVSARGTGWSTIQGLSVRAGSEHRSRSVAWVPGLAGHVGGTRTTLHVFAMGAVGREPGDCLTLPATGRESRPGRHSRTLLGGAALEVHGRRGPD